MTKVEAIKEVLIENGGIANLDVIYSDIKTYYPNIDDSVEWKAGIRGVLYREIKNKRNFKRVDEGVFALIDYNKVDLTKRNNLKESTNKKIIYPDDIDEQEQTLSEGAKKQIFVNAYERNPKARQQCIEYYGTKCFICGFDFEKKYGEIGKGFIHVHHIKPLSEINEEYEVNPIQDLRPVCPNCHAMIHKKKPAYSIEEIKSLLAKDDL